MGSGDLSEESWRANGGLMSRGQLRSTQRIMTPCEHCGFSESIRANDPFCYNIWPEKQLRCRDVDMSCNRR